MVGRCHGLNVLAPAARMHNYCDVELHDLRRQVQ